MSIDVSEPKLEDESNHITWKQAITDTCANIANGLLNKQKEFGTAIFRPVTILSHASASQALEIRIDQTIAKIQTCNDDKERARLIDNLIGYLVNYRAYMSIHEPDLYGGFLR
tara:strand:+ start:298 stop:636 length:339 start_codon:yes stop_codon:yes gene_type:complete